LVDRLKSPHVFCNILYMAYLPHLKP
jgi:hypothetical protein